MNRFVDIKTGEFVAHTALDFYRSIARAESLLPKDIESGQREIADGLAIAECASSTVLQMICERIDGPAVFPCIVSDLASRTFHPFGAEDCCRGDGGTFDVYAAAMREAKARITAGAMLCGAEYGDYDAIEDAVKATDAKIGVPHESIWWSSCNSGYDWNLPLGYFDENVFDRLPDTLDKRVLRALVRLLALMSIFNRIIEDGSYDLIIAVIEEIAFACDEVSRLDTSRTIIWENEHKAWYSDEEWAEMSQMAHEAAELIGQSIEGYIDLCKED